MKLVIFLILAIFILPIISIFIYLIPVDTITWHHLYSTVLFSYVINSIILCFAVGVLSMLIGTSLAWLIVFYDFPLRKFFSWSLLLPFAFPSYILAYIYYFNKDNFIELNTYAAAIIILSLSFYPYVYLFSKQAFQQTSKIYINNSKLLGKNSTSTFLKITLPLAQPSICAGVILVCIEVLSDFGTVDFFSIDTLSTGVYRTWFGFGSINGAVQISFILILFIFLLVMIDKICKKNKRFLMKDYYSSNNAIKKLGVISSFLAIIYCMFVFLLGFLLPIYSLFRNVLILDYSFFDEEFFRIIIRSLVLSVSGGIFCVIFGCFFGLISQFKNLKIIQLMAKLTSFGYAIPGSILSLLVLINFKYFENFISKYFFNLFQTEFINTFFYGTVFVLYYAYIIKFSSIAFHATEGVLLKTPNSLFWASKILGNSSYKTVLKIYLPLLKKSLVISMILIFVDIIKELPMTMILRPFNFETIAIKTYNLASDEKFREVSPYALFIVILGIFPIYILSKCNNDKKKELK